MGILNQKLKKQLESCNVTALPGYYFQVQPRCYESSQDHTRLIVTNLVLENNQVQPFIDCLKFRSKNPNVLVQIKHAEVKRQENEYCKFFLFIENISLSLQQLMSVTFSDMISIIYYSISGFSELLKFHGKYFTIESYMIGINEQGQVRVWSNRDYAKHQPKVCYSFAKSGNKEQAQQNMVSQLKTLFFCKVDKNSVPPNFNLQSKNFTGLLSQLQNKVGKEKFLSNFQYLIKIKHLKQFQASVNGGSSSMVASQDGRAPLIRFSYEVNPVSELSCEKPKINQNISFNYSKNQQPANLSSSQVKRIY